MRPLFTIHAGEVLVGEHIEREYKHVNVWIPSKDTGVDFLVTDDKNKKVISLQVKFSKDYLPSLPILKDAELRKGLRACGWLSLNRKKIKESRADYWIFLLHGYEKSGRYFVIIKPAELLKRLNAIYKNEDKDVCQTHFWVAGQDHKQCWETRGLNLAGKKRIAENTFSDRKLDFTKYLNNWSPIEKLNGDRKSSVRQ